MTRYTLPRTGNRPLSFDGGELATATTRAPEVPPHTRWHELALYRAAGGSLVVAIGYRTRWQGEIGHDDAIHTPDAAGAAAWLRTYDPAAHLLGYPPGEHYAERQERVARELRQRYEGAVSAVLAALEPEVLS